MPLDGTCPLYAGRWTNASHLAQYILRNPFSVEKMTLESPRDTVIYRSRLNAKINRNFEVFTPTDFLAAITQHIPDKGAQMVRYYGWYSNKMRGVRQRGLPAELLARRPGISPPPPAKLPSKRWHDLILRVWHVDPLRCPVCQNPMRVIAVIDDPRVVEKILRHLGAWHDPPTGLSPPGAPGPYTYEPCDDVDPRPLCVTPHKGINVEWSVMLSEAGFQDPQAAQKSA